MTVSAASRVMTSPHFRNKWKAGPRTYQIALRFWRNPIRGHELVYIDGHTWNEAFKKANLTLITERLGGTHELHHSRLR